MHTHALIHRVAIRKGGEKKRGEVVCPIERFGCNEQLHSNKEPGVQFVFSKFRFPQRGHFHSVECVQLILILIRMNCKELLMKLRGNLEDQCDGRKG